MTGYRDIFCILLFICIIHSVDGTTAVFCTDGEVSLNDFNSKHELISPNLDSKAHYNISRDCEKSVNVNITQPYVVHIVQASVSDCTERFRVLDASKNTFTDQTINCMKVDERHIRAVDTYFRSGGDQTLLVQLPAGYDLRVNLCVSVSPIDATSTGTTASTKITTTTSTTTTSTATTSTITTSATTTSTATTATIPTTTSDSGNIRNTAIIAASTTKNSNSSLNQKDISTTETGARFPKPFLDNETNQIAVGVGAGGFLLIVVITVLACVLASRHKNRKRQDEKETIELTTDATNGFALMTGERQSGVEQVDDNVGAASMAIPDYEYHSVEADSTVHGQQSTGNVQGRLRTTADRPHIEEEYATINKPFKQMELNDSSDQVPSQADKQAASGDLAGGEEVRFVDNEFYSTGGGDWVGL